VRDPDLSGRDLAAQVVRALAIDEYHLDAIALDPRDSPRGPPRTHDPIDLAVDAHDDLGPRWQGNRRRIDVLEPS
jgi:hypothetical protein